MNIKKYLLSIDKENDGKKCKEDLVVTDDYSLILNCIDIVKRHMPNAEYRITEVLSRF